MEATSRHIFIRTISFHFVDLWPLLSSNNLWIASSMLIQLAFILIIRDSCQTLRWASHVDSNLWNAKTHTHTRWHWSHSFTTWRRCSDDAKYISVQYENIVLHLGWAYSIHFFPLFLRFYFIHRLNVSARTKQCVHLLNSTFWFHEDSVNWHLTATHLHNDRYGHQMRIA